VPNVNVGEDLAALAHQSLGRPLTAAERDFAAALETIFATGQHDLTAVADALARQGVVRPSGAHAPWSLEALMQELAAINAALDAAYARGGAA
jgi:hypothetical protein